MKFSVWCFLFKENVSTSMEEVVFWRYGDVRNTKILRSALENSYYILESLKKVMTALLYFIALLPKTNIC